jgi:tetratricopeptide (TPR) repeat protein
MGAFPMRSRFPLALLLCACTPLVSKTAQTQEKLSSAEPDYSKEAFIVQRFDTRLAMEADGTGTRELTAEVKILAEAGVKGFAVLSFTYTTANEVVEVNYVRVRKPDGSVINTPDYNVQDMPGQVTRTAPMYSDIHEKHVAVRGLGVGDVLEYQIRNRVVKPQVPGHFWYEHSFLEDSIVKDERLEISVPQNKYVKVKSPEFKPEIKDEGTRRIYRWTHSALERKEKNPTEQPKRIPPDPSIQITTFANWEDVGRWYADLQKEQLEITPAIKAKAAELTQALGTDDQKFRAIYNYVSLRFHYVGLDFGIGRYQPHSADDVLGSGYGDCKDKHTLLAGLLKAAGYEAWPALIHSIRKLDPDMPSPAQFNHVITVIANRDKLIWLDTTPEVAPYGLLLTPLRNKQALVIPWNRSPMLMKTPADPPFPQEQSFSTEGKLDSEGTLTAHVEQTYKGDFEVPLRVAFRQISQSQWKELTQNFSLQLGFGGDVSNVQVSSPEETEKRFQISYDYVRKTYSDWEDRQFTPPLPPIMVQIGKETKKPSEPIIFGAPGEITYHAKVTLPTGYSIVPPKGIDVTGPFADYHATSSLDGGVLTTSRKLIVKQSEVPLSLWEDFRKFAERVSDDEFKYIALASKSGPAADSLAHADAVDQKFREGTEALQNRDVRRAQELLQEVIAADPKYPGAHYNLAVALATQNQISDALAEFRKEQEITPGDARSYQAPAVFLTYIGRNDEAIQEWRKLLKVDPKNRDAALSLGQLLVGKGKYSDAAEMLENAVKSSPDSPSLQMSLGDAYVRSGQVEKGIPHLRKAVEEQGSSKNVDPMMLNNAAYLLAENKTNLDLAKEYGEKALGDLEARSIPAAESDDGLRVSNQLFMVWDTVGWVYFQMGDTAQAERFIRPAWVLGQASVVGGHLGQIYEKLGKRQAAARVYELAIASSSTPSRTTNIGLNIIPDSYKTDHSDLVSRYQKLTGNKFSTEIRRLPNGEWTRTPAEQLSQMREAKFGKGLNLAGSARFSVVFVPGKVESVRYVGGDESLKSLTSQLSAVHYQMEFPAGSKAKIVRRLLVSCYQSSGCTATMVPPSQAASSPY